MYEFERYHNSLELANALAEFPGWDRLKQDGVGPCSYLARYGVYGVKPVWDYSFNREFTANGWMVFFAEFLETGRVVRHTIVVSDWEDASAFWNNSNQCNSWLEIADSPLMNPAKPHKRLRREMSPERFLQECGATEAQANAWAVRLRANKDPITFRLRTDITNAYEAYGREGFWSCMTGSRSECVESYETNPGQLVMCEAFRGERKVGRFLLYRFQKRSDPWNIGHCQTPETMDDIKLLGFVHGRVYSHRNDNGPEDFQEIQCIKTTLSDEGIKSIGNETGYVPVRIGPSQKLGWFDDDLHCYYSDTDAGSRAIIVAGRVPEFARHWTLHTNDSVGRYLPDADRETCTCDNCGCEYDVDDEDAGHVNGWGHCCSSCYGDAVYCDDTEEMHAPDDTRQVRYRGDGGRYGSRYVSEGFEGSLGIYHNSERRNLELVQAEYEGNSICCPSDETIETYDGTLHWIPDPDNMSGFKPIVAQMPLDGKIEECESFAGVDDLVGEYVDRAGNEGYIALPFCRYPNFATGKFRVVQLTSMTYDVWWRENAENWVRLDKVDFGSNNIVWTDSNEICRAAIRMGGNVIGQCLRGWMRNVTAEYCASTCCGMHITQYLTHDTGIIVRPEQNYRGVVGLTVDSGGGGGIRNLENYNTGDRIRFDGPGHYGWRAGSAVIRWTWRIGQWMMLGEFQGDRPIYVANTQTNRYWSTDGFDIPINPCSAEFLDFMNKLSRAQSTDFSAAYNEVFNTEGNNTNA